MLESLFSNVSQIALIAIIWQVIAGRFDSSQCFQRRILIGVLMGVSGCVSIFTAVEFMPGHLFDLRSATVAAAAFFGGPVSASIVIVLTAGSRVFLGGSGVIPGLVAIFGPALVGLALRRQVGNRPITSNHLAILSAGVAFAYCFAYAFVPLEKLYVIAAGTMLPVAALNLLTTFCLSTLFVRENRRLELVRANAIYRQMVELLPDPLNAKDKDGRFLAANAATAELMCAKNPAHLIGKTDSDFFSKDQARDFAEVERRTIETKDTIYLDQKVEIEGHPPKWMTSTKVPILDTSGKVSGVITLNRDVTEQYRLQRMKTEFVATVSHELRTPMTSLRGSIGLLSTSLEGQISTASANLLSIAQRNCERLVRLINDVLDVERVETETLALEIATYKVAPLIDHVRRSFVEDQSDEQIKLQFIDRAPDAIASIDPDRFSQALTNLVSNGLKNSNTGDTVTIALDRQDDMLFINITDLGSGIPENFHDRLFDKFVNADGSDSRSKGGIGLGLHLSKLLIERMDGKLTFETSSGQGTTFSMTFPERIAI